MRAAAAAIDGRVPFLPGTGTALMAETLELTAEAQRLARPPRWSSRRTTGAPSRRACFAWYSRVAREFPDLPIIVYNVPVRAAVDIAPATVGRLRRAHDNIVGIKETTRDFEHVSYVLNEAGTDFIALSGHRAALLPDARARRRRPSQLRRQLRAAIRSPSSTTRSSPATTSGRGRCTTTCTRWSMPPSRRPTRCR